MSQAVQQMFDRIAVRYDFLNRFLSLRRDVAWRKKACRMVGQGDRVLDLCGGTGDFFLTYRKKTNKAAVGIIGDFSAGMLQVAQQKDSSLLVAQLDALTLPFQDQSFDVALCGFGMRNLDDLDRGLSEVSRVLILGGRFAVLEFFKPENPWTRFFYGVLGPVFIPIAGAVFSGRKEAYEYLVRSVQRFVSSGELIQRGRAYGFDALHCIPLDGGIAHLVILQKKAG